MGFAMRAIVGTLFSISIAASAAQAQDVQVSDEKTGNSALELSKAEEIVELLSTSYAADLAMHVTIRAAECTKAEPRCAPLYFAQDVILGPWNFAKLLRVTQERPDTEAAIFTPRDYPVPALPPPGVLSPELASLAEYVFEQQVVLYRHLEAWQISMERYTSAAERRDDAAAAAQRRAIDKYSAEVSTAAAHVSAASVQFLEGLTPLVRHFSLAISPEDGEIARNDLRDNGFGAELQERFATFGIAPADSKTLLEEIFAMSDDAPIDLMEGLSAVARGYDRLADITAVPTDAAGNLRPVANAGSDQIIPAGADASASVELNATGSTDAEGNDLEYLWTGRSVKVSGPRPSLTLPAGVHFIALTAADGKGGTDVDLVTITVSNAAAPRITALTASPDVLSPANGQLVPVELGVKVTDNDDPQPFCQVISVGVDEVGGGTAGTPTEPDIVLDGTLKVLLRAELAGKANRVYGVTVQCTDKTNHSSSGNVFVTVRP
jgi:hypothetical protein